MSKSQLRLIFSTIALVCPCIGVAQQNLTNTFTTSVARPDYGLGYNEIGFGKHHAGQDFFATTDSNIYASAFGKVVAMQVNGQGCRPGCNEAGCDCADHGLGNAIILEHTLLDGRKVYSLYAHNDSFAPTLSVGKCVAKGTLIGIIGATGYGLTDYWTRIVKNKGPHSHLELKSAAVLDSPDHAYCCGYTDNEDPSSHGYFDPGTYIGRVAVWDGTSESYTAPNGQTPVHPVGTLVRTRSSGTIYVVSAEAQLRGISHQETMQNLYMNGGFGLEKVIVISDGEFARYQIGNAIDNQLPGNNHRRPDGTLISSPGGEISIVTNNGGRRPFTSAGTFTALGYSFCNAVSVNQDEYDSYSPVGAPVTGEAVGAPPASGTPVQWTTKPPDSFANGATFTLAWNIANSSNTTYSHIHMTVDPNLIKDGNQAYIVRPDAGGLGAQQQSVSPNSAFVGPYSPGTTVYFIVHASNGDGVDNFSEVAHSNVSVASSTGGAPLQWTTAPPSSFSSSASFTASWTIKNAPGATYSHIHAALSAAALKSNPYVVRPDAGNSGLQSQGFRLADAFPASLTAGTVIYFIVHASDGASVDYYSEVAEGSIAGGGQTTVPIQWTNRPPDSFGNGEVFPLTWLINSAPGATYSHVHMARDSRDLKNNAFIVRPDAGSPGPQQQLVQPNDLVSGSFAPGTAVYFMVHASDGSSVDYYSESAQTTSTSATPTGSSAVQWITTPPSSFQNGQTFTVSWVVNSAPGTTYSHIHVGLSPGALKDPNQAFIVRPDGSVFGLQQQNVRPNDAVPGPFSVGVTVYFIVHASDNNGIDFYSEPFHATVR
jgi:hypothetical protein